MPLFWEAKAPGEVIEREWVIPVDEGDSVQSYTASASGVTLASDERSGETVTLRFSGGTVDTTATITLSAVTTQGLTLNETAYLPIRATTNAFSYTVSEILSYALRPIVGIGAVASAAEQEDALENLNDMLAELREAGGDIGIKLPAEATDSLFIADDFISALKNSLRVRIASLYGAPLDQTTVMYAMRGMQRIKASLLPDKRKVEYF